MRWPDSHNRRWSGSIGRRGVAVALGGLATLGLVGCGSNDQPGLGAGVAAPTTAAVTTTTVATTTTTTIDFDRPITQGTTALAGDIGPGEVAALVIDARGQTAGIAAQVQRLAPFLDLTVAPVAQISGLDVTLAPEVDGSHRSIATVRFRVPDPGADLIKAISDEFVSLAWNTNSQTTRDVDGGTATDTLFRKPGFAPEEAEFRSTVTTGSGPTTVELTYVIEADDEQVTDDDGDTYFERLATWQEGLSLPQAAELTEVGVTTGDDAGTVFARYLLDADDEAEALATLARAAVSGDYELLGAGGEDVPTAGPLRLVDESGNLVIIELSPGQSQETFIVEARHGFEVDPLD